MKFLGLFSILVVMLLVFSSCITRDNQEYNVVLENEDHKYGNSIGNVVNGGLAVRIDNWIYFSNEEKNGHIYKMQIDGSRLENINNSNSKYLNLYEDWIYFINLDDRNQLYKIKLDSSGETAIRIAPTGNILADNILIVDEWLYYRSLEDKNRVYRLNLNNEILEQVTEESVDQFFIYDGWVYFIKSYDVNTKKIYKAKIGDNSLIQLNTHHSRYLNLSEDWIFYTGQHTAFPEPSYIYKMRTDGSDNTLVCQVDASDLNVSGDWLYFSNWDDDYRLYKIRKDGNDLKPLSTDNAQTINVVDDRIIYVSRNEGKTIYKTRLDGTEKNNIFNGNLNSINVVGDNIYFSSKTGLYEITTDGNALYKINADNPWLLNVYGDYIFYDMNGVYMIKTDQSTRNKLTNNKAYGINIAGQWLFYKESGSGKLKMLQINNELMNKTLFDEQPRGNSTGNIVNDGYAVLHEGWIYYIDYEGDYKGLYETHDYFIYKMKPDGSSKTKVTERSFYYISNLNAYNGWIYFINYLGGIEGRIYRIRLDGSDFSMVNWFHQDEACCLTVVDDWLYYTIRNKGLYKMRIDGRERQMIISDSETSNLNVYGEWIYYVSDEHKKEKLIIITDLEGERIIIKN